MGYTLEEIGSDLQELLEAVSPDADEFMHVDGDGNRVHPGGKGKSRGIQRYSPGGAAALDEPLDLAEALELLDDYRFRLAYRLDRIALAMERLGIEDGCSGEEVKEYILRLAAKYEEQDDEDTDHRD